MPVIRTTLPVISTGIACLWVPSVPLRERMVREIEDRVYSKEYITFEILANIVLLLLLSVLFLCFVPENPSVPHMVWLAGYVLRYLFHLIFVWFEFRHVARRRELELQGVNANAVAAGFFPRSALLSFAYSCDLFNILMPVTLSLNVGLFLVKSGDKLLRQNAPCLYWWFTRAYVAYDVTFGMLWLAGITACCCLPCLIVILRHRVRTVAEQREGALEEDLNVLPKYRFHMSRNLENPGVSAGVIVPMDTSGGDWGAEHVLPEDSECCICFCSYDDGIELHVLPCNHHFHSTCIEKWLKINATCPVCNNSILKGSASV